MHGRKKLDAPAPGRAAAGVPAAAPLPAFVTDHPDGVTLDIRLQPRASKNEIGAAPGAELRIKVTAPPVEAAANEALLRLLADALDCSRGQVELIRGQTARRKVVKVHGLTAAVVLAKLNVV